MSAGLRRVRVRVEGTVQGVGFRPYVHRLAGDLGLAGFVLNDARGVVLEIEADGAAVERFLERLAADAPPLATVERVEPSELPPLGDRGFAILASERGAEPAAPVAADAATCDDCLAELRDPADRRYRYPFVNCTACGPASRSSSASPTTASAPRWRASRCAAAAGPSTRTPATAASTPSPTPALTAAPRPGSSEGGQLAPPRRGQVAQDPVAAAAAALDQGAIVAVKGIGGFHLACRADDEGRWRASGRASGARRSHSR